MSPGAHLERKVNGRVRQDLNTPVCHSCEQRLVCHLRLPKTENKNKGFG